MYGEFVDDSLKWNSREQNTNRKIQLILLTTTDFRIFSKGFVEDGSVP
jgi:hypothetical protein